MFNKIIISATPEENQSKYNRLVSNCLQGLTSLIVSLPSASLLDCEQSLQQLVDSNKFWKFAKIKDPLVCFHKINLIIDSLVLHVFRSGLLLIS